MIFLYIIKLYVFKKTKLNIRFVVQRDMKEVCLYNVSYVAYSKYFYIQQLHVNYLVENTAFFCMNSAVFTVSIFLRLNCQCTSFIRSYRGKCCWKNQQIGSTI